MPSDHSVRIFDKVSEDFIKEGIGKEAPVQYRTIAELKTQWFVFEAVIRQDKCLVIHLKNLRKDFRNKKMLDYLTKYISDRIGGRDYIKADFIGEIGGERGVIKLNSLDIFVHGYLPAKMHDEKFVANTLLRIGNQLNDHLNVGL